MTRKNKHTLGKQLAYWRREDQDALRKQQQLQRLDGPSLPPTTLATLCYLLLALHHTTQTIAHNQQHFMRNLPQIVDLGSDQNATPSFNNSRFFSRASQLAHRFSTQLNHMRYITISDYSQIPAAIGFGMGLGVGTYFLYTQLSLFAKSKPAVTLKASERCNSAIIIGEATIPVKCSKELQAMYQSEDYLSSQDMTFLPKMDVPGECALRYEDALEKLHSLYLRMNKQIKCNVETTVRNLKKFSIELCHDLPWSNAAALFSQKTQRIYLSLSHLLVLRSDQSFFDLLHEHMHALQLALNIRDNIGECYDKKGYSEERRKIIEQIKQDLADLTQDFEIYNNSSDSTKLTSGSLAKLEQLKKLAKTYQPTPGSKVYARNGLHTLTERMQAALFGRYTLTERMQAALFDARDALKLVDKLHGYELSPCISYVPEAEAYLYGIYSAYPELMKSLFPKLVAYYAKRMDKDKEHHRCLAL